MKAAVYDTKGKEARSIDLPERVFGSPKRDALVYQVVIAMEANARTRVAHVKGRGEVAGGGKKPWKQKGTGRARWWCHPRPLGRSRLFEKSEQEDARAGARGSVVEEAP